MESRIVLLTGALSSSGKAITKKLLSNNYLVILNDDSDKLLKEYCSSLKSSNVYYVSGCPYKDDDVNKIFKYVEDKFGKLDVLINNYSDYINKSFLDITIEELQKSFKKNVISIMLCTQKASELMINKGIKGHIVNRSSDHGFVSDGNEFDSSLIGWALRGTTRASAKQLAKADIKVNAYCVNDVNQEGIADLVYFLINNDNVNITGQNIMLNDGRYMD